MEQSVNIESTRLELRDARELCAEACYCDRGPGLWNLVKECADSWRQTDGDGRLFARKSASDTLPELLEVLPTTVGRPTRRAYGRP